MTGAATVRKCRTVAKTVPPRRYYQMGCLPVRTPVEFGPLAIGVPRDSLSMICMCLFFAFSGAKDASMGFRTFVPSNAPQSGNFGRSRRCHRIDRCRAHARVSCVWDPRPQDPKRRGDFGDIGDIFRRPSNHAGLRVFESGDILGMSPRGGDAFPVRSKRLPARLDVRPRNPRNIHEIHKISTSHKPRKPAQMLAFLKISTKSTISTGCHGCVSHACVSMRAKVRSIMRHLVTICHRLREWPFFRVFGGQRRFDGFPGVPHRNAPKRAFFWRARRCHRIDRRGAHARVSCAWESRVPT